MSSRPPDASRRTPHRALSTGALALLGACTFLVVAPPTQASSVPAQAAPYELRSRAMPADRDADGLSDGKELGAAAVSRPALTPLTTALARRGSQPVRLLFLGSSTSYGVGASSPAAGYVAQVVAGLQVRFPAGSAPGRRLRSLRESTERPDEAPGVQGVNGAAGGSTAATYYTDAHHYGVGVVQPTCVVHMIGSNDSVAQVPAATFRAQVETVIRRVDAASDRAPCHVLLQPARRYQVSLPAWQEYGDALRQVAQHRPRVTFIDVGSAFEAHGALAGDPEDLVGPDGVHPTDAGHALLARTVLDALALARRDLGTGTDPRRADTDGDGLSDARELHRYVVRQRVSACNGSIRLRLRTRTLPYVRDTDGDTITDRREAQGYRLANGRLVRTDPASADTDGDGRPDGREAARPHRDPTTCE